MNSSWLKSPSGMDLGLVEIYLRWRPKGLWSEMFIIIFFTDELLKCRKVKKSEHL